MSLLKVMTLNIGNPSLQRVQKQIDWLETRDEDVFVLTETKLSQGCLYLEEYFGEVGFYVVLIMGRNLNSMFFSRNLKQKI